MKLTQHNPNCNTTTNIQTKVKFAVRPATGATFVIQSLILPLESAVRKLRSRTMAARTFRSRLHSPTLLQQKGAPACAALRQEPHFTWFVHQIQTVVH